MIEDTKGVFRSSKSKEEGQCNEKRKKRTNNDITQKTKERAPGTLHISRVWTLVLSKGSSFSSICDTSRVTIATNNKIMNKYMSGLWLQQT